MPLDQVVIPDMPELYYAAVRALRYSEPSCRHSSDGSTGALRDACLPKLPHTKLIHRCGGFSSWLHNFLSYLVAPVLWR
jgi:hypothetical protein